MKAHLRREQWSPAYRTCKCVLKRSRSENKETAAGRQPDWKVVSIEWHSGGPEFSGKWVPFPLLSFSWQMNPRPKPAVQIARDLTWANSLFPGGTESSHRALCPEMPGSLLTLLLPMQPLYVCLPCGPRRTTLPSQDIIWKCTCRGLFVLQWDVSPFQTLALAFPPIQKAVLSLSHLGRILLNPAQLSFSPRRPSWLPCHHEFGEHLFF